MKLDNHISATGGASAVNNVGRNIFGRPNVMANMRVCQNEVAYHNRIRPTVGTNLRVCPNVPQVHNVPQKTTMGTMMTVGTHGTAMSITTPHNAEATLAVVQNGNHADNPNGNQTEAKNLSERFVGTRHALSLLQKIAAMAMFMLFCTTAIFAQGGQTGPLTWELQNGTLTITGTGAMPNYDQSGYTAAPWRNYLNDITNIVIGNGVTSIGRNAFRRCSSLISVTIPSSVTSIGEYAFVECSSLPSVTVPNSVTSIGGWALGRCSSLTAIVVAADNANYSSENGVL